MGERVRERKSASVCESASVWERKGECECVRERECECEREGECECV